MVRAVGRQDGSPVSMYSMAGLAEYSVIPSTAVFALADTVNHVDASILGCAIFTAYGGSFPLHLGSHASIARPVPSDEERCGYASG